MLANLFLTSYKDWWKVPPEDKIALKKLSFNKIYVLYSVNLCIVWVLFR